jgi:hypothetical protein
MSHSSFVQQEFPFDELSPCPGSGSLLSIGLLGDEGHYTMPRTILEALAAHLGGMIVDDLPPFFVACKDGLALVITIAVGAEFVGSAFMLPYSRLGIIDRFLDILWTRASKDQCSTEFFAGTPFRMVGVTSQVPGSIEENWRSALC